MGGLLVLREHPLKGHLVPYSSDHVMNGRPLLYAPTLMWDRINRANQSWTKPSQ